MADRKAVDKIVGKATLYRRLPSRVIDCDGELFDYLVDHPEVVVDCWNVMGVSRLQLEPKGNGRYQASDTAGAVGDVRVLHREGSTTAGTPPLRMLILANGTYEAKPMPHAIRGSSVMLLRAEAVEEANGRSYVTTHLDTFIRFDQAATKLVAKTLQPLIFRTADHNFIETMRFVSIFSRTAETNPSGMQRLSTNLTQVDPATQREFAQVCQATAGRYANRQRQRVAIRPPAVIRR